MTLHGPIARSQQRTAPPTLWPAHADTKQYARVAAEYVTVRDTHTERGRGVFALRAIPRSVSLGVYRGELLTAAELEARYGGCGGDYVLQIGALYVDAVNPAYNNWCAYLNDARGTGQRYNVVIGPRGVVRSIRAIPAGQELFLNYGKEYWRRPHMSGAHKTIHSLQ